MEQSGGDDAKEGASCAHPGDEGTSAVKAERKVAQRAKCKIREELTEPEGTDGGSGGKDE